MLIYILILVLSTTFAGHTKEEWKSRTIYQILTDRFSRSNNDKTPCYNLGRYCGGTWKGITNNLNYIEELGFDAIWITPLLDNTPDGYHGYWARDWEKLNDHFGDENSLLELIDECHKRDIWVMIDVVANHVGPVGQDYSSINPFNSQSHYHDPCDIEQSDFDNNQWRVENCRLSSLPDLNHENPFVKEYLLKWIKDVVNKYKLDGIRIDTGAHTPRGFWKEYTKSAGVFTMGEIFNPRMDFLKTYIGPFDTILNYPLFFAVRDFFRRSSTGNLWISYTQIEQTFGNELDYMGIFTNNHDNPRLKHYVSESVSRAAIGFSLIAKGIPIFYYGDEQDFGGENDPNNREPIWANLDTSTYTYKFIKTLNKFRKEMKIWEKGYKQIMYEPSLYVIQRDNIIAAFSNTEEPQSKEVCNVEYPDGTKLCNYLISKDCVTVMHRRFYLNLGSNEMVKLYVRKVENTAIPTVAMSLQP